MRAVIVDASAIVSVDLSAADRLVVLHQKLARRGVRFYLTEHIGQVNDELRRYGADSLIESGAVRRTLLSALQDCGLWSGPMPRPEEELRRQTQEFEWAYGDEAEERMEQLAAQTLQTLEHTESADRPEQLEHLIHSGRWHGEIDRDAFISHLEEHIAELAVLLSRSGGERPVAARPGARAPVRDAAPRVSGAGSADGRAPRGTAPSSARALPRARRPYRRPPEKIRKRPRLKKRMLA